MKTFAKHSNCPASHKILSYVEGSLRPLVRQRIARHCAHCDFCGAEAELFAKFKPSGDNYAPAPTPILVTVLGVKLPLGRPSPAPARRAA